MTDNTDVAPSLSDDDRRRVIEVALEQRPDLDTEQLRTALARVGIEVDDATLEADLDALGYEIDDDVPPAAPPAGDPAAPAPAADRPGSSPGPVVTLAAACLVIAFGLVAVLVFGPVDDDLPGTTRVASTDAAGPRTQTAVGEEPGRVSTTVPVVLRGPGSDPELAGEGVTTLDFAAGPAALEAAGGVGAWELDGAWEAADGTVVVGPTGEDPATAILPLGQPDVAYEARLVRAPAGAGIVFRASSPDDYWALLSTPAFGTVTVVRVTPEGSESIANTGPTGVADGITMGVRAQGPTIEVLVNGLVLATVTDDDPDPGGGVGFYSARAPSPAVFDDVRFRPGG